MFDRLRERLLGREKRPTHSYQCFGCRKTVEATAESREEATCPDCGSDQTRRIVGCRREQERPF